MEPVVSVLVLLVAIASLAVAFVAIKNNEKQSSENFRVTWTNQVVEWADKCIEITSKMRIEVEFEKDSPSSVHVENLIKLSSLIDQGRLLFENEKKTEFGVEKQSAYQGFRPTLLDHLVDTYDCYRGFCIEKQGELKGVVITLETYQRNYVSDIQDIIEPNWFFVKAKFKDEDKEEIK